MLLSLFRACVLLCPVYSRHRSERTYDWIVTPWDLIAVCAEDKTPVDLRLQEDYGFSYYFFATVTAEHMSAWRASYDRIASRGQILWLQCWHPIREPVHVPAAPLTVQLPCGWHGTVEQHSPSLCAPTYIWETWQKLLALDFRITQLRPLPFNYK